MIVDNAGRLKTALEALARFIAAGRTGDEKQRIARQRSPAGWPISRDAFARQLKDRLDGNLPNQQETSYCGPAAFLVCLIHDRPDIYATYALSLWEHGHFSFGNRQKTINIQAASGVVPAATRLVTTRVKDPAHNHVNDIDWMTMACLSTSTRPFNTGAVAPDDQVGSITYPTVLRNWFTAAGAQLRTDTMGLGLMKSATLATLSLMKQWGSSWIVLQIDSTLLKAGNTNTFGNRHWVVVDPHTPPQARKGPKGPWMPLGAAADEIMAELMRQTANGSYFSEDAGARAAVTLQGTHMADWETNLRVVSWANEHHGIYGAKLGRTFERVYGGYAFGHFK